MKIKITFKDPDTLYDAIKDAVDELKVDGLSESELETVKEKRVSEYSDICGEWFEYGEYVTLEVDTEAKSIRVVPVNEQEK